MDTEVAQFIVHLQRKLLVSPPLAAALARELIDRFLPIKRYLKDFDAEICSPSPMVDVAWHELILFTKFYAKVCGKSFIHHNPDGELDSVQVKAKRYMKTLEAYEDLFGARPTSGGDNKIWPLVYPGLEANDNSNDQGDDVEIEPARTRDNRKRKAADVAAPRRSKTSHKRRTESQKPTPIAEDTRSSLIVFGTGNLQIYVRKSFNDETLAFNVDSTDTIGMFKDIIEKRTGITVDKQRLIFGGNQMDNSRTLRDYHVQNYSTIVLLLGLTGC